MISPDTFFVFSKSWFSGLLGAGRRGKKAKNGPKWQKNLSNSISQELPHMIVAFGAQHGLQHVKNKGVRQSHALSQNSEALDMWKVVRHPPSRYLVACNDYSFYNTIVLFFLQQWDSQTIVKLKLKQASKEFFSKEFHHEKMWARLAEMLFTFISQFHKVHSDLKSL